MKIIEIKVKALSPIILTANRSTLMTNSANSISGAILRGVYAQKYIKHHNLTEAHEDETFRRFFFGDLRFICANPVRDGKRSAVVPYSVQVSKDGMFYNDLLNNPKPKDFEKGYKGKKGLAVFNDNGEIAYVGLTKNTTLHIDRHSATNRISGSSQDGGVFTYEAIESGTEFIGYIAGSGNIVDKFAAEIRKYNEIAYIGRSHQTQYGRCLVSVGKVLDIPRIHVGGKTISLRLETPLVTPTPVVDAKYTLKNMLAFLGDDIEVKDIYGGQEELHGFNSAWGYKNPAQYALAAGTVFKILRYDGWDEETLTRICYDGIGVRREEGFGQLRIWNTDNVIKPLEKGGIKENSNYTVTNPEVQRIAKIIIEKRLGAEIKLAAYEDVQNIGNKLEGKVHAFAMLESLLGKRCDLSKVQERFVLNVNCVKSEQFNKHIDEIKISERTLKEKFEENINYTEKVPPRLREFAVKANIATDINGRIEFDAEICGAAYYDYWLWFFRHARKAAQALKKEN